MITGQDGDGLERLPETHVVAEDSVELVPAKKSQPVDPGLLVGSQVSPDLQRDRVVFQVVDIHQLVHEGLLPGFLGLDVQGES